MLTIETPIPFPTAYPLSRLGKLENLLFFDIETTGFSGDYSNLYLIGCWISSRYSSTPPGASSVPTSPMMPFTS